MKRKVPKTRKEVSVGDLAILVKKASASTDDLSHLVEKTSVSIDDLARLVGKNFGEMREDLRELESTVSQKIDGLSNRIDDILVTKATRDEVRALDRRVERLEQKLGVK